MPELYFTRHATDRMRARAVTPADIEHVLTNYRQSWSTHGQITYQGDDLTVVVVPSPGKTRVLTVLLNSEDPWSDEDVRARART